MKNINILIAAISLLLIGQLQAQDSKIEKKGLLWEISGKTLEEPSYLFGTIHMIPEEHYLLSPNAQHAFDESAQIVFEIDTEAMTNPAAMMGLMGKMYMNNDTSLADLVSQEDYTLVSNHFEEIGLPMVFLSKIKPMFLTVLAGDEMKNMGLEGGLTAGGEGIKSYELELTTRAKEQKKTILGLETAEFQMSLFDSIPYTAQAKMLVDAVKTEKDTTANEDDASFEKMIELYTNEDIQGMQSLMGSSEDGIGAYEDILLLKRNRNWIPVMETIMAENTAFFAVGAGHLGGEEGVIELLRKAGYTLKAIPQK